MQTTPAEGDATPLSQVRLATRLTGLVRRKSLVSTELRERVRLRARLDPTARICGEPILQLTSPEDHVARPDGHRSIGVPVLVCSSCRRVSRSLGILLHAWCVLWMTCPIDRHGEARCVNEDRDASPKFAKRRRQILYILSILRSEMPDRVAVAIPCRPFARESLRLRAALRSTAWPNRVIFLRFVL